MARLPVTSQSPFYEQACVAGSIVLGSAVGAIAGAGALSVQGALAGAAVGFVLGEAICIWEPIDRTFRDHLDFEGAMRDFHADNGATSAATDKLAAVPTVRSRDEAGIVLRFTLNTVLADPSRYWKVANERRGERMSGSELHGATTLANTAAQILAAQKA